MAKQMVFDDDARQPLLAGVSTGRQVEAQVGLMATGELKLPVSQGRRALRFGVEGGVYTGARVPIDDEMGLVVMFAVGWRILRQQYLTDGGATREQPWVTTIAVGSDWR